MPVDVLLAVPTPPPYAGPEVNSELILRLGLGPDLRVHHVSTNIRRHNRQKGGIDARAVLALARIWARLAWTLARHRPRVVYFCLSQNRSGFLRDAAIALTARLAGARLVAHVRGGNFRNFHRHASAPLRALIAFVLARCDRVIVLAERFRGHFDGLVPPERLRVLHNPVDLELLDRARGPGAPTLPLRIVYVGHLSVAKGFAAMLDAAPAVLDAVPGATLAFAGEWLERERNILFGEASGQPLPVAGPRLRERWDELRARYPGRVEHVGALDRPGIARLLAGADLFALPSYSEGLPTSVLEAMAAGLALVVTPVGALPEILEEGANTRFVPPGDAAALAAALASLATDPELRRAMGGRNRALAVARFAPRPYVAVLAGILLECVGEPQPEMVIQEKPSPVQ